MQNKPFIWPHDVNNSNKENKLMWSSYDLHDHFYSLYERMMNHPSSYAFRNEVDPEAMDIPEYRRIIKRPMALNTIRDKLQTGRYHEPWDVVNDFYLIFDNAMTFNKPSTGVYRECVKLLEYFKEEINPLMKRLGFCCGIRYTFEPQTLACNLCDPKNPVCAIWKGNDYYSLKENEEEPVQICSDCFNKGSDQFIVPSCSSKLFSKSQFKVQKNDVLIEESFLSCSNCGRKWHSICALHISSRENPFLCDMCLSGPKVPVKELSSERLPTTDLSEFIENRLNSLFLERQEVVSKVTVRVMADTDLQVDIKPEILEHYSDKAITSLPYRSKTIFAFQKVDGYDIVFFALYTQEYDHSCPSPNKRRIYVSYLDSVHYFSPRNLRTEVYHTILISYFEFCRQQDFHTAHLWACPPGSGDDYVFHQHPIDQKVPKKKRLINWYKQMLVKAVNQNIVLEYKNIHEYILETKITNPVDIPYFEGDFWPNAISEMLTEDPKELHTTPKKRKLSKNKTDLLISPEEDLHSRMLQLTKKFNEEFFVIILNRDKYISSNKPLINVDPKKKFHLRNTSLTEMRDSFLFFCKEANLEFSTLRRAKFTTMRILDEIFQENKKELFDCDVCKKSNLSDRYTCPECLDFDLCPICYEKLGHKHQMNRVRLNENEIYLGQMLCLLEKAVRCRECRESRCIQMKNLLLHSQYCKLSYLECSDCYSFTFLMVNHTHYCRDPKCRIMFCREKREKDKKRESQIMLQRRYNEIQRYQATKERQTSKTDEGSNHKSHNVSTLSVSFEELERVAIEFRKTYSEQEWKEKFFLFLSENPEYKKAKDLYEKSKKVQSTFTQLGKKTACQESPPQVDQNNAKKKPEIVEKQNRKSGYFLQPPEKYSSYQSCNPSELALAKPLPKNHVVPVESLSTYSSLLQQKPVDIKPEKTVTPLTNNQNQSTAKKRVQISNQN